MADIQKKAMRFNSGKPRWSLVDFNALVPLVRVLEFGADKYAPDNWKLGLDRREILDSMMRHIAALADGEANDPESGLPHIGHILCNAMFYSHFEQKAAKQDEIR